MEDLTQQQIVRRRKFGEPLSPDEEPPMRRHLIAVQLKNTIGALNRVCNLFCARGFNLESVSVGESAQDDAARLTLATTGNERIIAQVIRQLEGLVDTLDVQDLTHGPHVERELCLLKVSYSSETRAEIMDTLRIFRGNVVDVTPDEMTLEVTGPTKKINAFVGMMRPHGIEEIARTGRVAMSRSARYES